MTETLPFLIAISPHESSRETAKSQLELADWASHRQLLALIDVEGID